MFSLLLVFLAIPFTARIRRYLYTFNLYETPSSTVLSHQHEIWSTRLYVITFIACITTIILFTGLIEQTKSETILTPSRSTYEGLANRFPDTLQCLCSNISLPYQTFIVHLSTSFHPVCSSVFITEGWINYFFAYALNPTIRFPPEDFRQWGIHFFRLLQSYCSLSQSSVASAIQQFQLGPFISSEVVPSTSFHTQIDQTLELFQISTSVFFTRLLKVLRASAQGNALISVGENNWTPMLRENADYASLLSVPKTYSNGTCSCATSSVCFEKAAYYRSSGELGQILDGILFGCSYLEATLLSTLSCFFSNACISDVILSFPIGDPERPIPSPSERLIILPIQPLSSSSRFQINDTIETLVNHLFIGSWSNITSYERYYDACAPTLCSFSYRKRLNVLYVVSTFLGVFSGLSTAIRFLTPHVLRASHKLYNRLRNR